MSWFFMKKKNYYNSSMNLQRNKNCTSVKFAHQIENVWMRNYAVKISLWKFKPLKRVPQTKPSQDAQSSWKFKMVGIFSFFVKTKDWLYQRVFSQLLLQNTHCFDLPLLIRRYFCLFFFFLHVKCWRVRMLKKCYGK